MSDVFYMRDLCRHRYVYMTILSLEGLLNVLLASARPNNGHLTLTKLNWLPQWSLGNLHIFSVCISQAWRQTEWKKQLHGNFFFFFLHQKLIQLRNGINHCSVFTRLSALDLSLHAIRLQHHESHLNGKLVHGESRTKTTLWVKAASVSSMSASSFSPVLWTVSCWGDRPLRWPCLSSSPPQCRCSPLQWPCGESGRKIKIHVREGNYLPCINNGSQH